MNPPINMWDLTRSVGHLRDMWDSRGYVGLQCGTLKDMWDSSIRVFGRTLGLEGSPSGAPGAHGIAFQGLWGHMGLQAMDIWVPCGTLGTRWGDTLDLTRGHLFTSGDTWDTTRGHLGTSGNTWDLMRGHLGLDEGRPGYLRGHLGLDNGTPGYLRGHLGLWCGTPTLNSGGLVWLFWTHDTSWSNHKVSGI